MALHGIPDSKLDRYHKALAACARVAHDEFEVASAALSDAERLADRLRKSLGRVVGSQSGGGLAVEEAHERLCQLGVKLETAIAASLHRTRQSLDDKRKRLDKFTVTLFGRTMAGKSTIREALTCGNGSTIGTGAQRTTRDIREYEWNAMRIVDTPGIGAYEGTEDRELALSIVDQSDLILFLASSGGEEA